MPDRVRPKVWIVRAANISEVLQKRAIGVGWSTYRNVQELTGRAEFDRVVAAERQQNVGLESAAQYQAFGRQLFQFVREKSVDDYILTPIKLTRTVLIGRVLGDYRYDEMLFFKEEYLHPHVREIEWLGEISRDEFPSSLLIQLNRPPTIIPTDASAREIYALITERPWRGRETANA